MHLCGCDPPPGAPRSLEDAWHDDMAPLRRPVIRLPGAQTLLTRIDPGNRASSMVFKLRWGSSSLSSAISPLSFFYLACFLPAYVEESNAGGGH